MNGNDNIIFSIVTWLVPLAIAITLHEVAHGWVARANGDMTAARLGRLSLNPIKHVDPVGTVILPTFLAVVGAPIFGWAKPVPVQQRNLNDPRWDMVKVAAAGPGTNIILGAIGAVVFGLALLIMNPSDDGIISRFILANLLNFVTINIYLALFNMLPIPPFDGSKVLEGFLPRDLAAKFHQLDRYGFLILVVLLVVIPQLTGISILSEILMPPFQWIMGWMMSIVRAVSGL